MTMSSYNILNENVDDLHTTFNYLLTIFRLYSFKSMTLWVISSLTTKWLFIVYEGEAWDVTAILNSRQ